MQQMQQPNHLVVLVNGLWGWQRDWAYMKKALDTQQDGSYLIHVSAVNVGSQTYEGVDVCGHRLADEVLNLVNNTPSLTTISFIGHSMGGLIARYAVGLLTDTTSSSRGSSGSNTDIGTVAGLQPCCYISIATPHIGCSSSHPDEMRWQDRPYMRWLAAAVAGGYLGGHGLQHPSPAAEAAAAAAAAAEAELEAAAANCYAADGQASDRHTCHNSSSNTPGGSTSSSSRNNNSNSSSSRHSSSRSWPWTPCRSVMQLLGRDAWQPPPQLVCGRSLLAADNNLLAAGGSLLAAEDAQEGAGTDCLMQGLDGSIDGSGPAEGKRAVAGSSSSPTRCCRCSEPQLRMSWPPANTTCNVDHISKSQSSGSNASASNSLVATNSSRQPATPVPSTDTTAAEGHVNLLDVLVDDVAVMCRGCGAERQLQCLTGLKLFKHRLTYSSAGGDHLIPWCSSALLPPSHLPTKATKHAAAAATADSQQQQRLLHLPVLSFWATRPVIVEQQLGSSEQQAAGNKASGLHTSTDAPQKHEHMQQQQQQTLPANAVAQRRVLQTRLRRLQGLEWRRLHVVWPRLCLGNSHCNIQYNGPTNFVGHAVVQHVCSQVLHTRAEASVCRHQKALSGGASDKG